MFISISEHLRKLGFTCAALCYGSNRGFGKPLYPIGSHHVDRIRLCFTENPALEKQDTFVEKLVTQVIKNLQVKISNIHVRYEDDVSAFRGSHVMMCAASRQLIWYLYLFFSPQVTNPICPLSFGVSLKNLSLQVTWRSVPLLLTVTPCAIFRCCASAERNAVSTCV